MAVRTGICISARRPHNIIYYYICIYPQPGRDRIDSCGKGTSNRRAARRKTREKKVSDGKIKSYLDFRTSDTAGRLVATVSTAGVVLPYHSRLLHTPDSRVPIGTHYAVIVRVARDKNIRREKKTRHSDIILYINVPAIYH